MPMVEMNRPFIWLKIAQFIVGIVVYSLYFTQIWHGTTWTVKENIANVAAVGFPFVVLPVILLTSFIQGEGLAGHLICALFSCCGFIVSIVAGSCTIQDYQYFGSGQMAAGVFAIIFGVLFAVDVGWYAKERNHIRMH